MKPTFTKRPEANETLVRFWVDREMNEAFRAAVERSGIGVKSVYASLMKWFIEAEKSGELVMVPPPPAQE